MNFKRTTALMLLLAMLFSFPAQAAQWKDAYARRIVTETNIERARYGMPALKMDPQLSAAARIRAEEIAEKFSHTRPDGTRWKTVSDIAYAENIARGQKTPDKAVAAWMTSEGHRRNILRESYGSIGVACIQSGNVYYWVQLFGK